MISTAAIREVVPPAWLAQLWPVGRLFTPRGTDWFNGVMLTLELAHNGIASGRFSGDLAFLRIRSQRRALYGWRHEQGEPGLDRFGFHSQDEHQWIGLDEPGNVVRPLR